MFSKPICSDLILNDHKKNEVIQNTDFKPFTLSEYINNKEGLLKMKHPDLKHMCKINHLHVTGTKPILIRRIKIYYDNCIFAIKIQKVVRGCFVRISFKIRGAAFKNRKICTNTTDFYTMEPVEEIPFNDFFSYTDANNFTYGFDINSLIELYTKKGKLINPYNRERFTVKTIYQVIRLYKVMKIIFKTESDEQLSNNTIIQPIITSIPQPVQNNQPARMTEQKLAGIRETPVSERITAVFMDIDQLGHYTNIEWFTLLNKRQYYNFIREIYNIWRFRAQIPYMTKFKICPYDPISSIITTVNYEENSIETLREGCLQIIENMVYMGYDNEHRNLGTFHILTALTVVSIPARISMPWLYESIY
jgi:hypothetical protein